MRHVIESYTRIMSDGSFQICPSTKFAATPPHDGTLGRYYRLPADLAYPLPDNLSLEDGAMVRHVHLSVCVFYN